MNLTTDATPMLRTVVILDLLKQKLGSDYRTSLTLKKPAGYVANIRSREGILTDEIGLKAAELLDMPKEFILLSLAAERAMNSDTMKEIKKLADKYQPENMADSGKPSKKTGS
jgi:hypothetical protein